MIRCIEDDARMNTAIPRFPCATRRFLSAGVFMAVFIHVALRVPHHVVFFSAVYPLRARVTTIIHEKFRCTRRSLLRALPPLLNHLQSTLTFLSGDDVYRYFADHGSFPAVDDLNCRW